MSLISSEIVKAGFYECGIQSLQFSNQTHRLPMKLLKTLHGVVAEADK